MARCTECGFPNDDSESNCYKCGAVLPSPGHQSPSFPVPEAHEGQNGPNGPQPTDTSGNGVQQNPDQAQQPMQNKCPNCNYPIIPGQMTSQRCPNCHASLGNVQPQPAPQPGPNHQQADPNDQPAETVPGQAANASYWDYPGSSAHTNGRGQQQSDGVPPPNPNNGPAQQQSGGGAPLNPNKGPAQQQSDQQQTPDSHPATQNVHWQDQKAPGGGTADIHQQPQGGFLQLTPLNGGQPVPVQQSGTTLSRHNFDPNHVFISEQGHARFTWQNQGWVVENVAQNGALFIRPGDTFPVQQGDVLLLGDRLFKVHVFANTGQAAGNGTQMPFQQGAGQAAAHRTQNVHQQAAPGPGIANGIIGLENSSIDGDAFGMQYTLQQPQEIIGSNELTPNLQPGQPKYVSTKHLTFYQQNGQWMVQDYSRFSATFKKVNAAEHLPAESKLLIGKLLYQVSY